MPRNPAPALAAEEVLTAVLTYADRLHDLLHRRGLSVAEATAVLTRSAQDLVAGAASRDVTADPTGWWWARAMSLSSRAEGRAAPPERTGDPVEVALAQLPPPLRLAVLLRDTYDLPIGSVATALGVGSALTNERVLRGRLELVRLHDGQAPEPLPAEPGGEHLEPAAVVGVADGALPPADIARARRHLRTCPDCEGLVTAAQRGRRLVAALPLSPMPDAPRDELIQGVRERAGTTLPPLADVLLARESLSEEAADRSLISLPLVLVSLVGALLLGAITGAVTAPSGDGGRTAIDEPAAEPTGSGAPSPSATATGTPTPTASPTATAVVTSTPSRTVAATTAPPTTAPPVAGPPAITLAPSSGPNDADVTVTGTGWTPGSTVLVSYLDTLGQPQSSATGQVGANGRFRVTVVAHDPLNLPGRHTVRASDGSRTATASYDAQ